MMTRLASRNWSLTALKTLVLLVLPHVGLDLPDARQVVVQQ